MPTRTSPMPTTGTLTATADDLSCSGVERGQVRHRCQQVAVGVGSGHGDPQWASRSMNSQFGASVYS